MNNKINHNFKSVNLKTVFFAIFGSALMAFGTRIFAGAEIPEGGIVGLCLIIEQTTGISTAITSLIINALFYLLSWRLLGSGFIFNAAVATVSFSSFYALFDVTVPDFEFFIRYPLLGALVGAVIIETGTGLILRFGGAPSGDHALSVALAKRGNLDLGWMNFIRDFAVIMLAYTYADPYTIIYSIIIMTLTIPIMDYIAKDPKDMTYSMASKKKNWIGIIVTGLILTLILTGATIYVQNYYRADSVALKEYEHQNVDKVALGEGMTAYVPKDGAEVGLILYPEDMVEAKAYAPLLIECADKGIACVVIEMPYKHSALGTNKALDVPSLLPEVKTWYLAGHGMGGKVAAGCLAGNPNVFEGIILLGAYSANDISSHEVLSVYGSQDRIMNMRLYINNKDNLPEKFDEHVIPGGNHAYFGIYGTQKGDGKATVSNREQIELTAGHIAEFIFK